MKLEIGKRYVTRDGQITSPLERSKCGDSTYPYVYMKNGEPFYVTERGLFCSWQNTSTNPLDLVSEYVEPLTDLESRMLDTIKRFAKAGWGTSEMRDLIAEAESRIPKPEPLKLEAGKRYVAKSGGITTPLLSEDGPHDGGYVGAFTGPLWLAFHWDAVGGCVENNAHDLVREYTN